jgi:hypothetical protein
MENKEITRITVDIPTVDHKKLKMLAAFHGKNMREIFIELLERGLQNYEECSQDHTPNETTKKAIKNAALKKNRVEASSVEELFEKLTS